MTRDEAVQRAAAAIDRPMVAEVRARLQGLHDNFVHALTAEEAEAIMMGLFDALQAWRDQTIDTLADIIQRGEAKN